MLAVLFAAGGYWPLPFGLPALALPAGRGGRGRGRDGVRLSALARIDVENREPDGGLRRVAPFDAVAAMRRDGKMVAGAEDAVRGLVGEAQPRPAAEQQHPFGLRLVVPEAGRA